MKAILRQINHFVFNSIVNTQLDDESDQEDIVDSFDRVTAALDDSDSDSDNAPVADSEPDSDSEQGATDSEIVARSSVTPTSSHQVSSSSGVPVVANTLPVSLIQNDVPMPSAPSISTPSLVRRRIASELVTTPVLVQTSTAIQGESSRTQPAERSRDDSEALANTVIQKKGSRAKGSKKLKAVNDSETVAPEPAVRRSSRRA